MYEAREICWRDMLFLVLLVVGCCIGLCLFLLFPIEFLDVFLSVKAAK